MGLPNCFIFVNDYGLAPKLKPFPQLNELIKCFDKINENVGVNRAQFESAIRVGPGIKVATLLKIKFNKAIPKRNKLGVPRFRFGLAFRVESGLGVVTAKNSELGYER